MFTSLLAVPIAISFFNPFPFPSFNPFPFPTSSQTPAPTSLPTPSTIPSQAPTPSIIPAPSITTAVEIEDVDPSSANFMEEFIVAGVNFGANPGSVSFRLYNQSFLSAGAPIVSWTDTEIKAKVPAVKKGSYRIQVITADSKKSNEEKFTVKNGQPIINSTSLRAIDNEYELTFQGTEFGTRRGEINIYSGGNIIRKGVIKSWSGTRVRFEVPVLPYAEYGFQIQTSDGRQSSMKFFTVGN